MRGRGYGSVKYGCAVFVGDSISLGVRAGITAAQAIPALVGNTKHFVPSVNAGVGGNTSSDMLTRFEVDCLSYKPSMISIEAGTNDPGLGVSTSTYTANITEMVRKAKIIGARVTLWVPILTQRVDNSDIEAYRVIMRSLAASLVCDLFDTYADMAALPSGTQNSYFDEPPGSGIHFSVAGLAWAAGLVGSGSYVNSFVSAVSPR